MDDKTYPDATGQLWRVDPQGTHYVITRDGRQFGQVIPVDRSPPHGSDNGYGAIYYRVSRVEAEAPEVEPVWTQEEIDAGWRAVAKTCPKCMIATQELSPFDRRCADVLAVEVRKLILRNVIDSRSPAGDALIEYCDTDARLKEIDDAAREQERQRDPLTIPFVGSESVLRPKPDILTDPIPCTKCGSIVAKLTVCVPCLVATQTRPDILADLTAEELSHIGYLCDSEAHNARWTEIAERFEQAANERGK